MSFNMNTTDGFLAARADWKAKGCPSDHPYLTTELPEPGPVVPLIGGITTEMVAAAGAMGFRQASDANVRELVRRGR